MARGARGARWKGWLLSGLLVGVAPGVVARGQDGTRDAGLTHVRAADEHAVRLLRKGSEASRTFQVLLESLERSDLIVYE